MSDISQNLSDTPPTPPVVMGGGHSPRPCDRWQADIMFSHTPHPKKPNCVWAVQIHYYAGGWGEGLASIGHLVKYQRAIFVLFMTNSMMSFFFHAYHKAMDRLTDWFKKWLVDIQCQAIS